MLFSAATYGYRRMVTGDLADERALAELFAATAQEFQEFQAGPDRDPTLRRIARGAVETVPGCDYAGLMLVDAAGGRPHARGNR